MSKLKRYHVDPQDSESGYYEVREGPVGSFRWVFVEGLEDSDAGEVFATHQEALRDAEENVGDPISASNITARLRRAATMIERSLPVKPRKAAPGLP